MVKKYFGKPVQSFNEPIVGPQAVIVWVNNDLCNKYSADDSDSFIYRVVKRLHIIVHIVRCIVGM